MPKENYMAPGPTQAEFNALDAEVDALNSKVSTYEFGENTLANIQSAIVTYAGSMGNKTVKEIGFVISTASGVFSNTSYLGTLERISATRLIVNVRHAMNANVYIIGNYKDGTWNWDRVATKSQIDELNSNITKTYKDTPNDLTVTTTSGTVQSASVRLFYDKGFANINGRIRIKDCVGRPTITISGIPSECPTINGYGNPTQVRMNGQSQGSIISDISVVAHTKGATTATITFENYIGDFPTETGGYIVTTFNVACC